MAKALESDSRFQATLHDEAGAGLGHVGLKAQGGPSRLVWNHDESVCLVLEGEIYDVPALERSLAGEPAPRAGRSQAELLLRLYERFGDEFASRLNGAFVVAIWNGRARRLTVANDRQGQCPVYYARVNGGVLFAAGVRALLADPDLNRSVDKVAVNQFLVYDHMLDDRTLVDAVRLLPQASLLTHENGQTTVRPYWTLRYPESYEPQPEAAYIEQFMHHLRQAVERQKPDDRPSGVLLSGGLDSRILLGLLKGFDNRIETLTFGIPGCDDARVASEVAAALGTRHTFLELRPDWLRHLADEAVRLTDGLGNIVNLHVLAPLEAQGRSDQVFYKGYLGDALLGYALKRQMWADYEGETRYQVHHAVHGEHGVINYDQPAQSRLFTERFRADVGGAVGQAYRDGMDRSGSSQLANQRLYFDLTQRAPRMTLNGVQVARARGVVRLPFCDNDLVDFVLTVPPGFLFERFLQKAALIKYFPGLAKIPLEGTGRPMLTCARDVMIQTKGLLSWHLRRAGLGWLVPREGRPYKDYDTWFRTILRPWVEDTLLQPRALERGYLQPEYIRQLVAEQMGGANHGVRIGGLLTLELWHRQFLD